jgi:RNA polymerase sigma factor (sigma-70 family)
MRDTYASTLADDFVQLIPSLRAYARALIRHSDEADDLVQETLYKAIANVDRFEQGTNLRAWLFTIMRNTFFTNVKKRLRESPAAADCASVQAITQPNTASYIEGQRIMAAINQLPEHHREILVLVVILGESYEDAAVICNCAVGTIKSRVNRARKMIIDQIGVGTFNEIF